MRNVTVERRITTRFSPTFNATKHIHLGHIVCLVANIMFTTKNKGRFFYLIDFPGLDRFERIGPFKLPNSPLPTSTILTDSLMAQITMLREIHPYAPVTTMFLNESLWAARSNKRKEHNTIINLDMHMGTTHIIRCGDAQDITYTIKDLKGISENYPIEFIYLPYLALNNQTREKIGSDTKIGHYRLSHLVTGFPDPEQLYLACVLYAVYQLVNPKIVSAFPSLTGDPYAIMQQAYNFVDEFQSAYIRFDINEISEKALISHDDELWKTVTKVSGLIRPHIAYQRRLEILGVSSNNGQDYWS